MKTFISRGEPLRELSALFESGERITITPENSCVAKSNVELEEETQVEQWGDRARFAPKIRKGLRRLTLVVDFYEKE
jgi:hypothetical protein